MADDDRLEYYVEAASALMGVTMEPEWRASVIANLGTIAAAAELVHSFSLPDEMEPAPVFTA